jgi:hypothetical protein
LRHKGLVLNPEVVMANHQDRIFLTETPTAGYATFNLSGSYLIAQQHAAHIISFNFFNIGDQLYRNHLSFIKEFAPEMGRGLRVTYTLRFFLLLGVRRPGAACFECHAVAFQRNSLNHRVVTDVSHSTRAAFLSLFDRVRRRSLEYDLLRPVNSALSSDF